MRGFGSITELIRAAFFAPPSPICAAAVCARAPARITQRLARNAFQLRGRTLDRKTLEAALAQRIERQVRKEEILELYVNRIYFGSGFHGIEAAARGYFGKPAAELTLSESALLAGIIRGPNKLSPLRDLDAATAERDVVLDRMTELHLVSAADASIARASRITVVNKPAIRFRHDYVTDAIALELETLVSRDVLDYGGLRICTTIDPQLQRLAQDADRSAPYRTRGNQGLSPSAKARFRGGGIR